jgi:hypothetical protein
MHLNYCAMFRSLRINYLFAFSIIHRTFGRCFNHYHSFQLAAEQH